MLPLLLLLLSTRISTSTHFISSSTSSAIQRHWRFPATTLFDKLFLNWVFLKAPKYWKMVFFFTLTFLLVTDHSLSSYCAEWHRGRSPTILSSVTHSLSWPQLFDNDLLLFTYSVSTIPALLSQNVVRFFFVFFFAP